MARNLNDLIKITDSGFDIAIFPEVRDALARAFQDIYGNDIDISSASADGQYITAEALVWSKILESMQSISNKINPNTSTGKYLDIIASLAGVSREESSYGTCNIYVKNINDNDKNEPNTITLIDKNAREWVWLNPLDYNGNTTVSFKPGEVKILTFKCKEAGKIAAYGYPLNSVNDSVWSDVETNPQNYGDIYQTINADSGFLILQVENAIEGFEKETDNQLKKKIRRLQASGSDTTIQGLISGLLTIGGIQDVYVIPNTEDADGLEVDVTSSDSVEVPYHNVFVGIRCQDGIHVDPNEIGDMIYRKLTAGVSTNYSNGPASVSTWVYPPDIQEEYTDDEDTDWTDSDIREAKVVGKEGYINPNKHITFPIYMSYSTTIYWYQATTFDQDIVIKFKAANDSITFSTVYDEEKCEYEDNQIQYIVSTLQEYFNNLEMCSTLTTSAIESIVQSCDLKTRTGTNTYIMSGGSYIGEAGVVEANMNFMYFNVHNTYYANQGNPISKKMIDVSYDSTTKIYTITVKHNVSE